MRVRGPDLVISGKTFEGVPAIQIVRADGGLATFASVEGNSSVTPNLESQVIDAAEYETITVNPITSTLLNQLDSDFVAENIKKNVDLFGLIGTLESNSSFHTTLTPATSGEVITIALSDEYKLPIAVIARLQPTEQINFEASVAYPSHVLAAIFTGKDVTKSSQGMDTHIQANNYQRYNTITQDHTGVSWVHSTTPTGKNVYSAFCVYSSIALRQKPVAKFYTTSGNDSKYGLMVGKTYDIWAFF